jgi:hypothetical protein
MYSFLKKDERNESQTGWLEEWITAPLAAGLGGNFNMGCVEFCCAVMQGRFRCLWTYSRSKMGKNN